MKKKLLILICSTVQFTSMVCSEGNEEDKPSFWQNVWPIRREYRTCLENALQEAGLTESLDRCQLDRNKALENLETELGLPLGELQKRMDRRAEEGRQGRGRGERQSAGIGHGAANAERRLHLRQYLGPIRRQYRECLEKDVPAGALQACQIQRDTSLAELGLTETELQRLMEQRQAERSSQGFSRSKL
jgi:hypothetical protein